MTTASGLRRARLYNRKAPFRAPGMALQSRIRRRVRSDGFLELLGRAEGNLLAGLDLDRFAGGGVAAHAGGALAHLEDAETDDTDTLALLEVLGDAADQVAQDFFGLLLGQFLLFGDRRRQMLERDGGRG